MSKNTIISDVLDSIVLESITQEMLTAIKNDLITRPKCEKAEPKNTCADKAAGCTLDGVMKPGFKVGQSVSKKGGDYRFDGFVVAAFNKISGEVRYVVEDDRGILHIYSDKNLVAGA